MWTRTAITSKPSARLWPERGWALAAGLLCAADDLRLRKKTPNSFHGTDRHRLLQERGVSNVGYGVTLAADAHSTTDGALPAEQVIAHHNRSMPLK